jgi:hypothetical protein
MNSSESRSFSPTQRYVMKRKISVCVLLVILPVAVLALWIKDRPGDEFPKLHEGAGPIAFNPKFGPKTTQDVEKYLHNRAARNWRGRTPMTEADRQSPAGKAAWVEAVDTLNRRWGLKPGMTQEEIDRVREDQEKVWAYTENTRTTRYKIRSWFRMNQ